MRISVVKTAITTEHIIYSDINLFTGSADKRSLVTQIDSINQNILVLLDTPVKSKWWRPRIGSNIDKFLFEPMDNLTASKIRSDIHSALETNGETRVEIQTVEVLPNTEEQYYYVELWYDVPTLNVNNVQFIFNLSKAA